MSFDFINPWMLAGLAGVSLPVLAHLLSRRKYDTVNWGAMQFLELERDARRRVRIEELQLILLRMLLVGLLVLRRIAHPIRQAASAATLLASGPEAPPAVVEPSRIHEIVTEGIDKMKTNADPVPLILVGGGAVLIDRDIPGTSEVITHEHGGVANAIGASIAQVGGDIDRVVSYDLQGRDSALADAKAEAIETAIASGAEPETIQVVDIEEIPLSYVPGGAVRLRIKVAGDLNLDNIARAGK